MQLLELRKQRTPRCRRLNRPHLHPQLCHPRAHRPLRHHGQQNHYHHAQRRRRHQRCKIPSPQESHRQKHDAADHSNQVHPSERIPNHRPGLIAASQNSKRPRRHNKAQEHTSLPSHKLKHKNSTVLKKFAMTSTHTQNSSVAGTLACPELRRVYPQPQSACSLFKASSLSQSNPLRARSQTTKHSANSKPTPVPNTPKLFRCTTRQNPPKCRAMNPTKLPRIAKLIAAASLLLALSATTTRAQTAPAAITTDPPRDKDFPAAMEAPDIISHNTRLNAVFYLASGAGPHPVVLLLHGFPGNEQNMDLAYAIRRAGWNVLIPHYRGSWGSAGSFSFRNAIEDTQAAVEFLRDPENAKRYRYDATKIVAVGHSMGGFLVA